MGLGNRRVIGIVGGQAPFAGIVDHGGDGNAAFEFFQFGTGGAFAAIQQQNVGADGIDQRLQVAGTMQHGYLKAGAADRGGRIPGPVQRKDRADAFLVAQGSGQRHHAFDMAIAESTTAIATDQGHAARRLAGGPRDGLLFHVGIDAREVRLALQQQQQVGERGFARPGRQPGMHRFDECQVVRRVDGQASALSGQRRIWGGAHDLYEVGMQLEIAGDMLARGRIGGGIHHQLVQGAAAEGIDALMGAVSALFQQHVIAVLLDQGGDQVVDEAGIDERRIG